MRRLLFFLTFIAAPALAHDFWIEPSNYSPRPGELVSFRLRVGENFIGDALPRMPASIKTFSLLAGGKSIPIAGAPNADPAGAAAVPSGGLAIGIYTSHGTVAKMDAPTLATYVREEGLENAVRAARVNLNAPLTDQFSRCAKTLLWSGGATAGFDRVTGLTLELVPLTNPFKVAPPGRMKYRLLYRGKPLAGALVIAVPRRKPSDSVRGRTDVHGGVELPLGRKGEWLIKAVHLVPSSNKAADVESYWASLTFRIPEKK